MVYVKFVGIPRYILRSCHVPRGNFGGATYAATASVVYVKDGAQHMKRQLQRLSFHMLLPYVQLGHKSQHE